MSAPARILVVDDERVIRNFLSVLLTANGYERLFAENGREAIAAAATAQPDLVLLDLGLPDMDGMQVLRELREWTDTPVIVVSAREAEAEKVAALDLGANDYVTKPFGNSELLARIRTALRQHSRIRGAQPGGRAPFFARGLRIDYDRRAVSVNGEAVHLTPIEYKIVVLLSKNAGKVLTHDQIIREVWGPFASDSQVLRVNMANIRRKLEPQPGDPRYIRTEVGVGYRMVEAEEGPRP